MRGSWEVTPPQRQRHTIASFVSHIPEVIRLEMFAELPSQQVAAIGCPFATWDAFREHSLDLDLVALALQLVVPSHHHLFRMEAPALVLEGNDSLEDLFTVFRDHHISSSDVSRAVLPRIVAHPSANPSSPRREPLPMV